MRTVRAPAVAGMFYPSSTIELKSTIGELLLAAENETDDAAGLLKAIIAPHAGYVYSGTCAARAYAKVAQARHRIRRVIVVAPCHRVAISGMAVPSVSAFATPLGEVDVDEALVGRLLALPYVSVDDDAHAREHAVEVHLPFLQTVLDSFTIVPIVVGQATTGDVTVVLEAAWGDAETLIVISSDLSHYLSSDDARQIDAATCRAIMDFDGEAIAYDQACGRLPIRGLLALARSHGLDVTTLGLCNSGDTAGDRSRVVGYGAWAFTEEAEHDRMDVGDESAAVTDAAAAKVRRLLDVHGDTLLGIAAASIDHGLHEGRALPIRDADYPEVLRQPGACFVTLRQGENLRGCIGSTRAHRPLIEDVAANGYAAAFSDRRFQALLPQERDQLTLSVAVLTEPAPMSCASLPDLIDQLRPRLDGIIVSSQGRRAVFLPQVWKMLPEPESFIGHLFEKAGLPPDHWSADVLAWRFAAPAVAQPA